MARVAPRRGRRVVPEGGVDEARAGIPVGRRSVPGGVGAVPGLPPQACGGVRRRQPRRLVQGLPRDDRHAAEPPVRDAAGLRRGDRKSTRLNSSHTVISYAVFCLKKKKKTKNKRYTDKYENIESVKD